MRIITIPKTEFFAVVGIMPVGTEEREAAKGIMGGFLKNDRKNGKEKTTMFGKRAIRVR